jgi:hypothetical protein
MASQSGRRSLGIIATLGVVAFGVLTGCSTTSESGAVLRVGSRNLRCAQGELETALRRESSQVREYYVGCDFMYTRVLCDKGGGQQPAQCHPAKPQPPCFGGGCFKEDPVTFEWQLDETLATSEPANYEALFPQP